MGVKSLKITTWSTKGRSNNFLDLIFSFSIGLNGPFIFLVELSEFNPTINLSPNFAAFINFSSDHVERHGGLGGYFYGKARLFLENLTDMSVINIDTAEGLFLYQRLISSENKIIAITSKLNVKNYL